MLCGTVADTGKSLAKNTFHDGVVYSQKLIGVCLKSSLKLHCYNREQFQSQGIFLNFFFIPVFNVSQFSVYDSF